MSNKIYTCSSSSKFLAAVRERKGCIWDRARARNTAEPVHQPIKPIAPPQEKSKDGMSQHKAMNLRAVRGHA